MISVGDAAPGRTLPAVIDGEIRTVDLAAQFGGRIVVLAFYPADFSPACTEASSDLDDFDLFTMQKDVSVFGISPDSVYSHRAFAAQYDLSMPLLADVRRELAGDYGLKTTDEYGQDLIRRGAVVVDHNGEVQYTWSAEDITTLPDVEEIRTAVSDIGGDTTALGRYRVGYAHYVEGRRAFSSAMDHFEAEDWIFAQSDFDRAREEFDEASDHFDSAARFTQTDDLRGISERGEEKSQALTQAADWLHDAANAFASGRGREGQSHRSDASAPLSKALELGDLPDPEDVHVDEAGDAHVDLGDAGSGDRDDAVEPPADAIAGDTDTEGDGVEPVTDAESGTADDGDADAESTEITLEDPDSENS